MSAGDYFKGKAQFAVYQNVNLEEIELEQENKQQQQGKRQGRGLVAK